MRRDAPHAATLFRARSSADARKGVQKIACAGGIPLRQGALADGPGAQPSCVATLNRAKGSRKDLRRSLRPLLPAREGEVAHRRSYVGERDLEIEHLLDVHVG